MRDFGYATYGDAIARVYDEWFGDLPGTQQAIETLAELAGDGPVLELGVGTGRLAIPLAEQGLKVVGIDASRAMAERLAGKPGGDRVQVALGNFAEVPVEGRFRLIFVAFNTFFGLLSQEEQATCFGNVADHLTEEGLFVLEAFVPDPGRFNRGQRVETTAVERDWVRLTLSRHDPLGQRVQTQHIRLSAEGVELFPLQIRYAWPSELDLMARMAGLQLRDRWSGWTRETFTAQSHGHVSVYERI